jgi:hypothetical protein
LNQIIGSGYYGSDDIATLKALNAKAVTVINPSLIYLSRVRALMLISLFASASSINGGGLALVL